MKKWLIFSIIAIVAGALMICIPMSKMNWEFERLDKENVTEMNYSSAEDTTHTADDVKSIEVSVISTQFALKRSGTEFALKYYESDYYAYDIKFDGGKLSVSERGTSWKRFFSMFRGFKRARLVTELTVPENFTGDVSLSVRNSNFELDGGTYSSIKIKTTNGKLTVKNVISGEASYRSTNGDVNLENLQATALSAETTNGSFNVKNVSGASVSLMTTNGNASVTGVQTESLVAHTTNGSVWATDCTAKNAELLSTNGRINSSNLASDVLVASTTNGEVRLGIAGNRADYEIDGGKKYQYQPGNGSGKKITAHTTNGSIVIDFVSRG